MQTETQSPAVKIEVKAVKHIFTPEERNSIGGDLARAIGTARGVEAEFTQVKASYKAKETEATARIDSLSTSLMNGFDVRQERCSVVYNTKERKKSYFIEGAKEGAEPVLVEDMTAADFEMDLIQAESKFERREEIELFPQAGADSGLMVVGRFGDKWFAALRVQIGQRKLSERLDSEQPCCKKRVDMIKRAAKRLQGWLAENLGADAAKGFEGPITAAVEGQKEREE
jgi:hypothetical protein